MPNNKTRLISDACEAEECFELDELERHAAEQAKAAATAAKKSKTELFDIFINNIAYHATLLTTDMEHVKCAAVPGMEMMEFRIQARGEHPDVWDSTFIVLPDGSEAWLGNRWAAINHYTQKAAAALRQWVINMDVFPGREV